MVCFDGLVYSRLQVYFLFLFFDTGFLYKAQAGIRLTWSSCLLNAGIIGVLHYA